MIIINSTIHSFQNKQNGGQAEFKQQTKLL